MHTKHLATLWALALTGIGALAQSPGYPPPPPPPNVMVMPGPAPMAPPPPPGPMVMTPPAPVMVAPPPQGVVVPAGVVYVAPTYPRPAVGFLWRYHPQYGWGWYHPRRGWHRGWR